tara:strand:+ start:22 stop:540 length:519 start_codon:yes stop_codon:yes gene_type:complete
MKFLIFNLLVLSCLGYIIMGKPNENFLQWASNTKEKVSNLSKEDFLKKIDDAIKVKKNNNLNKDEKQYTNLENKINKLDNNNILETMKLEFSKFDKKLDETLKQIKLQNNLKVDNTTSFFPNEQIKVIDNQTKDINDKEIPPSKDNQFMSNSERSNALADLITDMELYGIKN